MNDMEQMLIERCKRGDLTAFEILISDYERKVYNLAYRIVGNLEDAKDIAQDTFIKAFQSIGNFKQESTFSTWIYRIAMNTGRDYLRKKKKTFPLDEIKDDKSIQPQDQYQWREESQEIITVLNLLKEEHRNILILRDIQGFSYEEIANILNISLGTVKSRISRGRYQLKSLLLQSQNKRINS